MKTIEELEKKLAENQEYINLLDSKFQNYCKTHDEDVENLKYQLSHSRKRVKELEDLNSKIKQSLKTLIKKL